MTDVMSCQTPVKRKNNKGFSLVELIIVITIMAVLTAILAPQFLKYVERSREARDKANIEMVYKAFQIALVDGATISDGSIFYYADGYLQSIGNGLGPRLAETFGLEYPSGGPSNRLAGLPPLVSKKYKDNIPRFLFKNDTAKGYITLEYVNPVS